MLTWQINEDKKFWENVAQDLEQEESYSLMVTTFK